MSNTTRTLDAREQDLIDRGFARLHEGRLIPIMRGGDETEEEKTARLAAEEAARVAAAAAAASTFTQADVDRIVGDRLARDRKDRPSDDEINELREAKKKLDEQEAASLTELEQERARATKAEEAAAKATATANERLVQAAVLAQAAAQKAIKPEHLHKLIDTAAVTVGDDGQVTGAEEAVKAFLDANPEYVGTTTRAGSADQGARTNTENQLSSTEGMTADEIATATAEGRFDVYLASPK